MIPRLIWNFARLATLASLALVFPAAASGQATYEPDCNDPDAHDIACTEPTKAAIQKAHDLGYEYYIGHAEPTALFFSNTGASGNNMQWKFKLPATEPNPTQNGSKVANFELFPTAWIGIELCDPNSNPYGSCVAVSDSNNPATAGAAFMELQFYPPGLNCRNTQWCVRLHINTLEDNNATQVNNCHEPTTEAYLTTDGTTGGPKLLMNNGDTLIVTLHDTAHGLETDVNDVTTSTTGFMVASAANGFVHNANLTDCSTTGFDFHPMYMTAAPANVVPWAALGPNISFDFEIGHFELCKDSGCTPGNLPDSDSDDTGCFNTRGIGGCSGSDLDQDGLCYQADWPDGTSSHPASFIISAPSDNGVGPLSANTTSSTAYNQGYKTVQFKTTESTATTFYPFFSQAGTGAACVFNFGNDIPGTTTNDFGQAAQYAAGSMSNPCFPATATAPSFAKAFSPSTIQVNHTTGIVFTMKNPNSSALTGVSFTDTFPAGITAVPTSLILLGGTLTVTATSVSLTGATFPGSETVIVTLSGVRASTAGQYTNTTSAVTTDESLDSATAAAVLTVVSPPLIEKSFASPKKILPGGVIGVSFKVSNPNSFASLPAVGFTDTLPSGLVVATPNGLTGSCPGGSITATAASNTIQLSGATLTASSSCTFSVNVTAPEGTYPNTTGAVFDAYGSGSTASDTLIAASPATINKTFQHLSIPVGGTTNLTFTLTNPNHVVSFTGVAFTDTLPVGLVVSTPNGLTTTCGGSVTATAGLNVISASSVPLSAPGGSCTITVSVTAVSGGVLLNTTSSITSDQALPGGPAKATLVTGNVFEVSDAGNVTISDPVLTFTNSGDSSTVATPQDGALCVNVYEFSADATMVACCSCAIAPNGLLSLATKTDLLPRPFVGENIILKAISTLTSSCNPQTVGQPANQLAPGMIGWRTNLDVAATASSSVPLPARAAFRPATLSGAELSGLRSQCSALGGGACAFCGGALR